MIFTLAFSQNHLVIPKSQTARLKYGHKTIQGLTLLTESLFFFCPPAIIALLTEVSFSSEKISPLLGALLPRLEAGTSTFMFALLRALDLRLHKLMHF